MNPVLTEIFGFEIKWYSFLMFMAMIIGYSLIYLEAKKFKANQDFIFNLSFWTVIAALIGARLYYVVFNWQVYASDTTAIFKLWEGGLAIHGALLFGFLMAWLYCYRYKVRIFKVTDILVPAIILGQAIGRWGNFFNSEAHGAATTLANLEAVRIIPEWIIAGMKINGIYYLPTFYYESLWCLAGFIFLLIMRRTRYIKTGQLTNLYLMWYSLGRFFIEVSRTDSLMLGGFKVAQIVSVVLFVVNLCVFLKLSKKGRFEDLYSAYEIEEVRF